MLNDYTFQVKYDKPFAPSLISWGTSILPRHLLEGKDITKSPLIRKPIGTGPYVFKEWIPGDRVVLVANDEYFEGRPYIARHVIKIIPDSATMFLELKNNSIDSMSLTPLQFTKQTDYPAFKRAVSYTHLTLPTIYTV